MNNARCSASPDRLSQSQLRRAARAAPTLDCITGTAVLEFGPAETLSPVGASRRLILVSVDRVTSHSPHTRAKSRGFRPRRATPAERRTVCWRETDSNLRSPEETTFSRPRRSRLQSPPSGRETGFLSEKEQGFKSAFRRRSKDAAPRQGGPGQITDPRSRPETAAPSSTLYDVIGRSALAPGGGRTSSPLRRRNTPFATDRRRARPRFSYCAAARFGRASKGKGDDPAHRVMPMTRYLLIESRDPFDSNDVRFCDDLAQQLAAAKNEVTLFLVQN